MTAAILQIVATVAVIGALIWVRFAFTSLNRDLRLLLDRQTGLRAELAVGFEAYTASIDALEKRIKTLEDEVL